MAAVRTGTVSLYLAFAYAAVKIRSRIGCSSGNNRQGIAILGIASKNRMVLLTTDTQKRIVSESLYRMTRLFPTYED